MTRHPQGCGCCAGVTAEAPRAIDNRPGLSALAYRIGTHATFKRSALAALSAARRPELRGLTVRSDDDFSIALLDAWAIVADVLTFYQERIANEAYLGTATERLSVVELTRLIGYELAPGVAASTLLAFDTDDPSGGPALPGRAQSAFDPTGKPQTPAEVQIDAGTKAQSVPDPGQSAQTFETIAPLVARRGFSALAPQTTAARLPRDGDTSLVLAGASTGLRAGDGLAFLAGDGAAWAFRHLAAVSADAAAGTTTVTWQAALAGGGDPYDTVLAFAVRAAPFGASAPQWGAMSLDFRGNYPGGTLPDKTISPDWPGFTLQGISGAADVIELDGFHPEIQPGGSGGWLVLEAPGAQGLFQVKQADGDGLSLFTLSARTTRVQLGGPSDLGGFQSAVRTAVAYAASLPLAVAEQPVLDPLPVSRIPLATAQPDLPPGRTLVLTGKPARLLALQDICAVRPDGVWVPVPKGTSLVAAGVPETDAAGYAIWHALDPFGVRVQVRIRADLAPQYVQWTSALPSDPATAEAAVVAAVDATSDPRHTILDLGRAQLGNVYDRATVSLCANVAPATHGESVSEILGDGDASQPWQRFPLRQPPLTYVQAPTAGGAASTLTLRVNDLRWTEVETLFGAGPQDRVYVTERGDDGATTAVFGDGVTGARPPSGRANVRASYRKGLGAAGNARADQISILMSRPLGVRGVTNPLPATGGVDPQTLASAQEAAPVTVLTLGRVVSLLDYQSFAQTFAGVAKALATWTWDGFTRSVFLTVAGVGGAALASPGPLTDLAEALHAAGDPLVPVRVQNYRPAPFQLSARVKVDADHEPARVLAAVEAALRGAFSFERRAFGHPVALSEVMAVMQQVDGVVGVQVLTLYRVGDTPGLNERLTAQLPLPGAQAGAVVAAELLTLASGPLDALEELTDAV